MDMVLMICLCGCVLKVECMKHKKTHEKCELHSPRIHDMATLYYLLNIHWPNSNLVLTVKTNNKKHENYIHSFFLRSRYEHKMFDIYIDKYSHT